MVIVDASVVIGAVSPDEMTSAALALVSAAFEQGAISPALFAYEIENVLIVKQRRGALNEADRMYASRVVAELPIDIRPLNTVRIRANMTELAARTGLSIYDAAYLDLAIETGAAIATLDRKLRAAALAEGITVL